MCSFSSKKRMHCFYEILKRQNKNKTKQKKEKRKKNKQPDIKKSISNKHDKHGKNTVNIMDIAQLSNGLKKKTLS